MRGQDHVFHAEQRVVVADWLRLEHVEARARDQPVLQRLDHGGLVNGRAAAGVHEQRRLLHLLELRLAHHVIGVLGAGRVHGHDVGALQQLVVADRLHAVVAHHQLFDIRVIGQHLKAERRGAPRNGARDMAEGDEAQRHAHQARELVEVGPCLGPFALAHHLVLHHQAPPRGENERHGMVGHFLDERVGHVRDGNAELGRRRDIDRVDADAAQRHDLELLAGLNHLG